MVSLLGFECMVHAFGLHDYFVVIGMGFVRINSDFILTLRFPGYPWCDGINSWFSFGLPEDLGFR